MQSTVAGDFRLLMERIQTQGDGKIRFDDFMRNSYNAVLNELENPQRAQQRIAEGHSFTTWDTVTLLDILRSAARNLEDDKAPLEISRARAAAFLAQAIQKIDNGMIRNQA